MSKLYAQKFPVVSSCTSGCFGAAASMSASYVCNGYAYLMGFLRTDQALDSGSGLIVRQSVDGGVNWDYVSASDGIGANASAACKIEIIGDAVQVFVRNGATAASSLRMLWQLRPI